MPRAVSGRSATAAQRRSAPLVALIVVSLVTVGCGSRLPDDVLARIDAGGGVGTAPRSDAASNPSGAPAAAAGAEGLAAGPAGPSTAATSSAATPTSVQASTSKSGPTTTAAATKQGGPSARVGATAADCSPGTGSEKGVSRGELKFASIVTASGPLPGATEGAYRGVAAYFAMINAQGGICGRKLTVLKGDDGLDSSRARSEFSRLEPQVLGFVGNIAVADSGYIDLLKSTQVPYVSFTIDQSGWGLKNVVPKVPDGEVSTAPFAYYHKTYPDVKKVGYLVSDVASVVVLSPPTEEAIKRSGFEMSYRAAVGVTDPDYTSHVIRMRQAGADFLFLFAFEINMQVRLARNMRQQNWDPTLKINQIGYNTKWYETMGEQANGWRTFTTYLPMLNPDEQAKSPALGPFNDWNKRLFPKDQVDSFPVTGWGDAAYLVEALRKVGPDPTRAKLLDALYAIPEIDDGGFTPPRNPLSTSAGLCFIAVKAEAGRWQREHPASGFECGLGERYKYK